MRSIERSARFKRDYKRVVTSGEGQSIEPDLAAIVAALSSDNPLPTRNRDHALTGEWNGFATATFAPIWF